MARPDPVILAGRPCRASGNINQATWNNMTSRCNISTRLLMALVISAVPMLAGCDLVFESLTRGCAYSETILPPPAAMAGAELTMVKDVYQGIGHDATYACLKSFDHRTLIMSDRSMSDTVRTWYKQQGVDLVQLRTDKVFQLVSIAALVKHGLSTIDSGKGPYYYLVMKDAAGALYHVSLTGLGFHREDGLISMKLRNAEATLITRRNFDTSNDVEHPAIQFRP